MLIAAARGLREARSHPEISDEVRWPVWQSYREALGKQLLTSAPNVAAVSWKRAHLNKYKSFIDVKKERVEQAIADDVAFLDAHPTRKERA